MPASAVLLLAFWIGGTAAAGIQSVSNDYSLDDWMSVGSVRSFLWSPDGAYLYFTRQPGNSGTTEIFRVESGGGQPKQLSTNPTGKRPEPKQNFTLSRDGKTLFFTSASYFQSYENIFMMPSSGGEATQLTFNDAVIETAPAPSPDGNRLAYFARTPRGSKIFLLDLGETTAWPRYFAPGPEEERFPVWSPDGRKLAFQKQGDIWIRNLEGRSAIRLIEDALSGGNQSPVWSPHGSRIAFLKATSGFQQVGVAQVQSGRVTPVTYAARQHSQVSWSPDGQSMVFIVHDETGMSRDVMVATADGSQLRTLSSGRALGCSPQFSPDGWFID